MYYQPPRAMGLLVGAVLTLWGVGIALLLVNAGTVAGVGVWGFLAYLGAAAAAVATGTLAYWTYGLATLSYAVDRNGLVITWGSTRQVIPLQAIERLVPGAAVGIPRIHGVTWWGHQVGRGTIARVGEVLFYSTHQLPEQVLYVMTTERTYAISVEDPAQFAREVQLRQELGPVAELTHHVERGGTSAVPFWADRDAVATAAAAIVTAVLVWVVVAIRYHALPQTIALHFPAAARTDVITVANRRAVLELPMAATVLLAADLVIGAAVHAWDRVAGYVVIATGAVAQLAIMLAVVLALR